MLMEQLIRQNRSYRRFYQDYYIARGNLRYFINLARLSPSAKNAQALKYIISNEGDTNRKIFECLTWAGYLKDWDGPDPGEQPSAYIIILGDRRIEDDFLCDHGIAAQSILLGAAEKGFGGCIVGSVNQNQLKTHFNVEDHFDILLVIALGKPKETVIIDEIEQDGNIEYWRDDKKIHHVPKRKLDDIIIDE